VSGRVAFLKGTLFLQLVWGVGAAGQVEPPLEGPYLGETPPGSSPTVFGAGVISGVNPIHGTPVFAPDGSEVFWSAVNPSTGKVRILFMRNVRGSWSAPAVAPFSRDYQNDVPFMAPDGETLYFVSDRPVPWESPTDKQNIWLVRRTPDGWPEPTALDAVVNSISLHWQVSVTADGTLYFATDGVGDIYSAAKLETGYARAMKLGNTVNTETTECCPFVSADGELLLFSRSTPDHGADLYASFRTSTGSWSTAVNLGRGVNADGHDLCPIVSPDGKYLFFLSNREGESAVYWVDMEVVQRIRRRR
jgi:dipeptidyl aminopeptidase/acylaminoacyl peptidase